MVFKPVFNYELARDACRRELVPLGFFSDTARILSKGIIAFQNYYFFYLSHDGIWRNLVETFRRPLVPGLSRISAAELMWEWRLDKVDNISLGSSVICPLKL